MSALEAAIDDLKALSPSELTQAADYIHRLRYVGGSERSLILERTAGSFSPAEADEMERLIADACERIDDGA